MEHLPLDAEGILGRPIDPVTQKGVFHVSHMHPNLVGTPGLQPRLNMGEPAESLQHAKMGYRPLGILLRHGLPQTILWIPPNGGIYRSLVLGKVMINNGIIGSGDTMLCQLFSQSDMCRIVFLPPLKGRWYPYRSGVQFPAV